MRNIFFVLLLLILLFGCATKDGVMESECTAQNGKIVNALGGGTCETNETSLGDILPELNGDRPRCDCICCVPKQ